jgi:hypothetical protein
LTMDIYKPKSLENVRNYFTILMPPLR